MKAKNQNQRDWKMLAAVLKRREGARTKEYKQLLEAGKGQGAHSPPEPPEGMQLCWPLEVSPLDSFWTSHPQDLRE